MERYFINLLLEQMHRGNKITQQAWNWLVESFNEEFGLLCNKEVLEQKYISLMSQYVNITNLLSEDGFEWDNFQQTVIADDDIWEAYIKVTSKFCLQL